MMNLLDKQKWDYSLGFVKGNPQEYCVVFETLVSNEALQWGLMKLTGQTHDLVLGEELVMSLEQIEKQEWSLLNAVPLKKIKNLKAVTKKCIEYKIVKKKGGVWLRIVVEGLREV